MYKTRPDAAVALSGPRTPLDGLQNEKLDLTYCPPPSGSWSNVQEQYEYCHAARFACFVHSSLHFASVGPLLRQPMLLRVAGTASARLRMQLSYAGYTVSVRKKRLNVLGLLTLTLAGE